VASAFAEAHLAHQDLLRELLQFGTDLLTSDCESAWRIAQAVLQEDAADGQAASLAVSALLFKAHRDLDKRRFEEATGSLSLVEEQLRQIKAPGGDLGSSLADLRLSIWHAQAADALAEQDIRTATALTRRIWQLRPGFGQTTDWIRSGQISCWAIPAVKSVAVLDTSVLEGEAVAFTRDSKLLVVGHVPRVAYDTATWSRKPPPQSLERHETAWYARHGPAGGSEPEITIVRANATVHFNSRTNGNFSLTVCQLDKSDSQNVQVECHGLAWQTWLTASPDGRFVALGTDVRDPITIWGFNK
jgi:hypothetical protein